MLENIRSITRRAFMTTSAAATAAATTLGAGAPTSIDDSAFRRLLARWKAADAAVERLLDECDRVRGDHDAGRAVSVRLDAALDVAHGIEDQLVELTMRRLRQPLPAYVDDCIHLTVDGYSFHFQRHHRDKTRLVSLKVVPPTRTLVIG